MADGIVELRGTSLVRTPPTVKLEGARVRGHRAVRLTLADGASSADAAAASWAAGAFTYGVNGVEERAVDEGAGERELGLLVEVRGGGAARNRAHLALLRATLLHYGFEGRKATAGNLAFPFSPSDLSCADGAVLTVCGTRDPAFISAWKEITSEATSYVSTLSDDTGLEVRVVPCGLAGMPRLVVEEEIEEAASPRGVDGALAALQASGRPSGLESWTCSAGMAADFVCQHLVPCDDELLRSIFRIRVGGLPNPMDGRMAPICVEVPAQPVAWGGPPTPYARAVAGWDRAAKPAGRALAGEPLRDLARVIRSKNAGVNELTFDLIFDHEEAYAAAKRSPALDAGPVGALLERELVGVFCDDTSRAIKITCDRGGVAGSAGDRDVYGAQQHRRLLDLVV